MVFSFQPNELFNPLQRGFGQRKSAVTDVLNRITSNIAEAQERQGELESTQKTQEAEMDVFTSEIEAARQRSLEEMPDGLLHYLRNQFLVQRNASCRMEGELTAFRDELMGLDQTIQEYQDIIDGKSPLPEDLTMEEVVDLLEVTRAAREQFIRDGVERLNNWNPDDAVTGDSHTARALERVLGENKYAGMDGSAWELDPYSADIYGEIDRVFSAVRDLTETMEEGYRRICNELERRGYTEWKYEDRLTAMREDEEPVPVLRSGNSLQFLLEELKRASEMEKTLY